MKWDHEVDYLVVGSGAAGMGSAIAARDAGLDTLVIEQADQYGGTTAWSGGVAWIPNNHQIHTTGISDSEADAWAYLSRVTGGEVDEQRLRAYIRRAREAIEYFETHSEVKFRSLQFYVDYYPEFEGGKPGGRSMDPVPFDLKRLGSEFKYMREPIEPRVLGLMFTAGEAHHMIESALKRSLIVMREMAIFCLDIPSRLRGLPARRLTLGQALVGRLRYSLMQRNVPLWLNTRLEELVVEDGCIAGALVSRDGRQQLIRARKGVMLGSGGFGRNETMRQQHHPKPCGADWTVEVPGNVGAGIEAGKAVGAQLEFMHCAWWTPTFLMPDGVSRALVIGKSMPGCIFVNKAGRRFTNEAAPYEDVVKGQFAAEATGVQAVPCWMVFDARYRRNYSAGPLYPATVQPDDRIPDDLKQSGWLKKADTLEGLANACGIDPAGFIDEIRKVNGFAQSGRDLDFGRGDSLHDRYYSDPKVKPNPNLGVIAEAPFYAFEVYPGDLGTKGGLKANHFGQVIGQDGAPIPGLYAAGNCSATVMGNSYPGAGSTIGPALTFGYLAARHAAGLES